MDNHTSLRAESERSGVNFTESLVDWPPTLVSTLKGCLGIVALVGVVAEVLTLRRITLFLGSISGHQVKSATARQHDDDLKRHPQLLFSFSICDMLQCGLCAPLVIFRKLSGENFNYNYENLIFNRILVKLFQNKVHYFVTVSGRHCGCWKVYFILVILSTYRSSCRSNFSLSRSTSITDRLTIERFIVNTFLYIL